MTTFAEELKKNRGIGPGFNMLRHVLAVAILIFHCYLAIGASDPGGGPATPVVNAPQLRHSSGLMEWFRPGLFSLVGAFFALSGFLVMGSAVRTRSMKTFFINRALRILPALSVEVLLSAFILGPLVTVYTLDRYFSDPIFAQYFWNLVGHIQFLLPGVFLSNPWPQTVNLSLWTLPAELYSYLFMLIALGTGLVRHDKLGRIVITAVIIVSITMAFFWPDLLPVKENTTHFEDRYIVLMFVMGAAFYLYSHVIPVSTPLFVVSAIAYYLMVRLDFLLPLCGIPLVYCTAYVGMCQFRLFDRIVRMDLSYGIYLYAFPITQTVVLLLLSTPLLARPSLAALAVVSAIVLVLTGIFAAASWLLIEKPALSLRRFFVPSSSKQKVSIDPVTVAESRAA